MTNNQNNILEHLPYLVIWESELEHMCGQANYFGNIETGGECYGLFSHGKRPVIMLVTPSGPNAIHQYAHFRQDMEFLEKTNQYIVEKYGLNLIGTHHSHHKLKIYGLSSGYILSTHAIASRNDYHRMCQILLTFNEPENISSENKKENYQNKAGRYLYKSNIHGGLGLTTYQGNLNEASDCAIHSKIKIKIHPFIYKDAQNGQPLQCPLKVIPGLSPIRRSIIHDATIPELCHHHKFSRMNMIYDSSQPQEDRVQTENNLPSDILDSIQTLTETIIEKIQFKTIDDLLILTLPLKSDKSRLSIIHELTPPYSIKEVSILADGKHSDITKHIYSGHEQIDLMTLYQRCERFIQLSFENDKKLKSDRPSQSLSYTVGGLKVRNDRHHCERNQDEPK